MGNHKKVKNIAKTAGAAIGGAALRGGRAALEVALAPIYIATEAVTGGIDAGMMVNHKKTIGERIDAKLEKMKK